MKRKPCVAGYFYPQNADSLRNMINRMVDLEAKKEKSICIISPHAGYEYSGKVAGSVFSSVYIPDKLVILGPSHKEISSSFAIMKQGSWETPLGEIPIDTNLAHMIMEQSDLIDEDEESHLNEHSIEVQLPFIQYFNKDISIVPINVAYFVSFKHLEALGRAISIGIREFNHEVLIVSSTDMSHYVSREEAKKKDFLAIEKILKLDAKGLHDVVKSENISMCGFQPTVSALITSKKLGAKDAELVKYQTSGDVSGNYLEVVGYAGVRIF